jgi:hypothetical protein
MPQNQNTAEDTLNQKIFDVRVRSRIKRSNYFTSEAEARRWWATLIKFLPCFKYRGVMIDTREGQK